MPEEFDAYHKWLGIRPAEQPPNHYRLLAINLFESDPDVIDTAADQRMRHLRTFQSGDRANLSQQLLNEVAAARVTLLDATKKAAYDAQLKQKRAIHARSRAAASTNVAKPSNRTTEPATRKQQQRTIVLTIIAIGAAVCLMVFTVLAIVIAALSSSEDESDERIIGNSAEDSELKAESTAFGEDVKPASNTAEAGKTRNQVAVCRTSEKLVELWDCDTLTVIRKFGPMNAPSKSVAVSPNGQLIAASCLARDGDTGQAEIYVWNAADAVEIARFPATGSSLWSVCWSPCGHYLAAKSSEGIFIWELATERLAHHIEIDTPRFDFSPSALQIAAACGDNQDVLCIWTFDTIPP